VGWERFGRICSAGKIGSALNLPGRPLRSFCRKGARCEKPTAGLGRIFAARWRERFGEIRRVFLQGRIESSFARFVGLSRDSSSIPPECDPKGGEVGETHEENEHGDFGVLADEIGGVEQGEGDAGHEAETERDSHRLELHFLHEFVLEFEKLDVGEDHAEPDECVDKNSQQGEPLGVAPKSDRPERGKCGGEEPSGRPVGEMNGFLMGAGFPGLAGRVWVIHFFGLMS
jgi:hypothetical protein